MTEARGAAGAATSGRTIDVRSPWDASLVGTVHAATAADVDDAVQAAAGTLADPLEQTRRARILDDVAAALAAEVDEVAALISAESGKPVTAARTEVSRAVDTLTLSAAEARQLNGHTIDMSTTESGAGHSAWTEPQPIGVAAAITPFNFPLNLVCHKVGPAVAADCPVVHKPASTTPMTAQRLQRLFLEEGLPAERYHVVPGPGREVGQHLATHTGIAHVSFTGSGAVGWALADAAGRTPVGLELGNSTAAIAMPGVDIDEVAARLAGAACGFAGQSCISVQRVIAHTDIHDDLATALTAAIHAIPVGDPADPATVVGPLITRQDADRALEWVAEAADHGATLLAGGTRVAGLPNDQTVAPTLLAGLAPGMRLFDDEAFAPILGLTRASSEAHAVDLANATAYGLQHGVFDQDAERALRIAHELDAGGVTINEVPTYRADQMPYGGIKDSGNTREGPKYAIRDLIVEKLYVLAD